MATDQNTLRFFDLRSASAKDQIYDAGRHQVRGYSHQVQRRQWAAAHGVNVGQGICGRDLSISKRIVDDWGEKIRRLHQCAIPVDAIHPCVVSSGRANQEIAALQDR
jgi:hypothetical protein